MGGHTAQQCPAWAATAVAAAVTTIMGMSLVALRAVGPPFLGAVVVALVVESVYIRHAHTNASAGETQPLTLSTAVTAARGATVAVLAGFVVAGRPAGVLAWLPAVLFGVEALLDWVDGSLARARDTVSAFGARLDTEIDALAILAGSAVAVRFGAAPPFYIAVGLARYVFVAGLAVRRYRGRPVTSLDEGVRQRLLAAVQMVVLTVVLVPTLDTALSRLLATAGMVPFLLGFVRDWTLVTGQ